MKRSERGANLVEFAIVLPLLVLILAGLADLGRAFYNYMVITNAAREGARGRRAPPLAHQRRSPRQHRLS